MAYLIGEFIGAIVPSFLLMLLIGWVLSKTTGLQTSGYAKYACAVLVSFALVVVLSALGNADGMRPDYALAFYKSAPSHLIASLLFARKFLPNK